MGYGVDKKFDVKSELGPLLPRLKSFAVALTGNGQAGQALLKAACKYVVARAAKEMGHTPLALWAFTQMHTLWSRREAQREGPREPTPGDPRLFGGQHAGPGSSSAAFAHFIAQLPPQQRGTLLLVYGEGWSYDEAAEVFGVPVSTVMTRLARSHAALSRFPGEQTARREESQRFGAAMAAEPQARGAPPLRAAQA